MKTPHMCSATAQHKALGEENGMKARAYGEPNMLLRVAD
jgi:hypothetical protein